SIGVFMVHTDISGADEKAGVRRSVIRSGKYKAEGNPYEPLGDEARAALQADCDEYYQMFLSAVGRHRGIPAATVEQKFGSGRTMSAKRAKNAGMVDRVASLEEVLDQLTGRRAGSGGNRAEGYRLEDDGGDIVSDVSPDPILKPYP